MGTRFCALAIDTLIQNAIIVAFVYALGKMGTVSLNDLPQKMKTLSGLYASLLFGFFFLVLFGYFILFELFWDGQTPGKKVFGLKVRRNAGRPLDFLAALIRNLVRIVDMQPFTFYLVGFIACFCHPQCKRIGDLAAGTIVIKERKQKLASVESGYTGEDEMRYRALLGNVYPPTLSEQDIRPIREFLRRRRQLNKAARIRLASALLQKTLMFFPVPHPCPIEFEQDPEKVLEIIYHWSEQERFGGY